MVAGGGVVVSTAGGVEVGAGVGERVEGSPPQSSSSPPSVIKEGRPSAQVVLAGN